MKNEFIVNILSPMYKPRTEEEKPNLSLTITNFLKSINIFSSIKSWPQFTNLLVVILTIIPAYLFFFKYFSWKLFAFIVFYNAIVLNVFSTYYFHRFSSHGAFKVKGKFGHFVIKNLAPRLFNEETFALAHYVHHKYPDSKLDPHKASDGFMHSFLSDFTQMRTNPNLDEKSYKRVAKIIEQVNIKKNTYDEYQRWGTIINPKSFIKELIFNWALWIIIFYFLGGSELLCAAGTSCFFWGLSVRNFNYKSHGSGIDKRKSGRDFDQDSISLNLFLPGFLCGEWHANHHIHPESAKAGFMPYQLDLSFLLIRAFYKLGLIESYIDKSLEFEKKYMNKSHKQGIINVPEFK